MTFLLELAASVLAVVLVAATADWCWERLTGRELLGGGWRL